MKTICITGGAGFIGCNAAAYFIARDYKVIVVDNLSAGRIELVPKSAQFEKLDIRDTKSLTKVFSQCDGVVHLAALPRVQYSISEPLLTHEVNVTGTVSVAEAARAAGVKRVVFASSSSVYGDQETLPLSINLPTQPQSPYALHKLQGEEVMRLWSSLYDLSTVSLRPFNVYGPQMDPDAPYALVIGLFLKLRKANQPLSITGDGEQTRDFTHVNDLARAIEQALVSKRVGTGEVLNIGAGEQTTINELAELIGGPVEYIPARYEPKHTLADISKTKELLNWEPTIRLEDGITELKKELGLG